MVRASNGLSQEDADIDGAYLAAAVAVAVVVHSVRHNHLRETERERERWTDQSVRTRW